MRVADDLLWHPADTGEGFATLGELAKDWFSVLDKSRIDGFTAECAVIKIEMNPFREGGVGFKCIYFGGFMFSSGEIR